MIQDLHNTGIWKSNCLAKEKFIVDDLADLMRQTGWKSEPNNLRIWTKGNKKTIICLVDDFRSCSDNYHVDLPYLFDKNTTVITDNCVNCPTVYRVIKLPDSFYGIYYLNESFLDWRPGNLYTFSVNRIDHRRLKLLLELVRRVSLLKGNVNFNCRTSRNDETNEEILNNFTTSWQSLPAEDQEKWISSYELVKTKMPLKNYSYPHEEIFYRSWINIDCETYSGDNSVALSEKIFRLLTTPAPWVCYMGRYAIAYLESLGFDCLSDVIDHNHYDRLKEVEDKTGIYVWKALQVSRELRDLGSETVAARCKAAAEHNKNILKNMSDNWDKDYLLWKQQLSAQIS